MYKIVEKYVSVSDHQEDQATIRSLEFSIEGRGAGNGVNDGSCLLMKASLKSQMSRVQRASRLMSMWGCWEGGAWGGGDKEALCLLPHTLLYAFLPSECVSVSFIPFFFFF